MFVRIIFINKFNCMCFLFFFLKEYNRRIVKPKTKGELVEGIKEFWRTVTMTKCVKYIDHLKKVIPRVIKLEGGANGY